MTPAPSIDAVSGLGMPERIYAERDEETNEKRWYSIKGMGVEYVRADALEAQARELAEARAHEATLEKRRDHYRDKLATAQTRIAALEDALRVKDEALRSAQQQCETAAYNLNQSPQPAHRIARAFLDIANGCAAALSNGEPHDR